jgi:hypothetical protein
MLVTTSLLPTALLELDWADPAHATNVHRQAVKQLRACARWVIASREHWDELQLMLAEVPQAARSMWAVALEEAFAEAAPLGTGAPDAGRRPAPMLEQLFAAGAMVVGTSSDELPSDARADAGCYVDAATGRELVRLDCLGASERLGTVETLQRLDVQKGTPRNAVWRERLEPLASVSRAVVLVDRWAGKSLLRDAKDSGATWLLQHLGRLPRTLARLELITSVEDAAEQSRLTARLREVVEVSQPAVRVQLTMPAASRFQSDAHARHLRFTARGTSNRSWAVLLDHGVQPLDKLKAEQTWPCVLGDSAGAKAREESLRRNSATLRIP